jgi:HlyD family secretion protein
MLAALGMVAAGCTSGEADEAPALSVAEVERGNLRITAEATGTVEPLRKVEVKSMASGEILTLHAEVGDEVEPGALLAEVDPRDVRNAFEQASADLEVAQARRDITQAQLRRSQELHEAGVITDQELENARLEFANAEANLIKARTNEELAELRLNDVTIRAPLSGTILERNVEEGTVIQSASQNVSGGSVLFTMAALDAMQVRTLVDETDMGDLRAGMSAQVTVEAYPDRVFQGSVEKIEPQAVVEQNVTMFPVIVRLDNRAGLLKPGMNAEVEILIDEADGVLLAPNNAIVNLSDVGPAAMALGLDISEMDLSRFRGMGSFGGRVPGGGPGGPGGDAPGGGGGPGEAAEAEEGRPAAPGGARMDSLRARVARGEISRDSVRALIQRARAGAAAGEGPAASGTRQTRRAVVFVVADSTSAPEPTVVEIGLNDWDRTQIVSGVEEGRTIAIIGAAQLQAQQQEFMERIRSRRGGPF